MNASYITLELYTYTLTNGRITAEGDLQTIEFKDANGDGLLDQQELREHFCLDENGKLRGTEGDPARSVTFAVSDTGNLKNAALYSEKQLPAGTALDHLRLTQNFSPFDPGPDCVPCFDAATLIETDRGPVAAGDLRAGDMVRTRDAGFQPLRWVGQRRLGAADLERAPYLRPIRIRAGALGHGLPQADLVVSPQHRVLVRSRIAQKMFGTDEVLVAARQLCQLEGIDIAADVVAVTYVHFLFDAHQIVFSNGAETESLHTGAEALKSVGPAARVEILTLFPSLQQGGGPAPARVLATGRMGRKLAMRHIVNGKPLVH
ncbi:MAG TPA: Hint domain-containing protein [Paracoccus sp. (in: a-proteobacteria)]|nr:Hint domain-containing protein [Paracoccus sp. (in: a-proteobacteria)]